MAAGNEESDQFDDGDDGEEMVSLVIESCPGVALIRTTTHF